MPIPSLVTADLTQANIEGTGVFDVLMRANKAHLEAEYGKNRIKGAEYATVYLGSLESVLRASVEFLLNRDKQSLESQLMEQKVLLAQIEVNKANVELAILNKQLEKMPQELAYLQAQTALITQQTANAVADGLNIPIQGQVLTAQKCKLEAEFDLILLEKLKTTAETALLTQKVVTEQAQTTALGVDADSVVGKQKALYGAQTAGFQRDAEQKAAKLMTDTWSVRRTTDEGTVADSTNSLNDATVGRAVNKMLAGVGA